MVAGIYEFGGTFTSTVTSILNDELPNPSERDFEFAAPLGIWFVKVTKNSSEATYDLGGSVLTGRDDVKAFTSQTTLRTERIRKVIRTA